MGQCDAGNRNGDLGDCRPVVRSVRSQAGGLSRYAQPRDLRLRTAPRSAHSSMRSVAFAGQSVVPVYCMRPSSRQGARSSAARTDAIALSASRSSATCRDAAEDAGPLSPTLRSRLSALLLLLHPFASIQDSGKRSCGFFFSELPIMPRAGVTGSEFAAGGTSHVMALGQANCKSRHGRSKLLELTL